MPEEINATSSAIALAAANGIDLGEIEGSGKDGRIVKNDVEDFLESLQGDSQEESTAPEDAVEDTQEEAPEEEATPEDVSEDTEEVEDVAPKPKKPKQERWDKASAFSVKKNIIFP